MSGSVLQHAVLDSGQFHITALIPASAKVRVTDSAGLALARHDSLKEMVAAPSEGVRAPSFPQSPPFTVVPSQAGFAHSLTFPPAPCRSGTTPELDAHELVLVRLPFLTFMLHSAASIFQLQSIWFRKHYLGASCALSPFRKLRPSWEGRPRMTL